MNLKNRVREFIPTYRCNFHENTLFLKNDLLGKKHENLRKILTTIMLLWKPTNLLKKVYFTFLWTSTHIKKCFEKFLQTRWICENFLKILNGRNSNGFKYKKNQSIKTRPITLDFGLFYSFVLSFFLVTRSTLVAYLIWFI